MIPARYDKVMGLDLATNLGQPGEQADRGVGTVEHLMAALAGLGVDNLLIRLNGPEVPAMDGSAQPFVELIEDAGLIEQAAARRYLEVLRPVVVREGDKTASLEPADHWAIDCAIAFANRVVGEQTIAFRLQQDAFKRELAPARTFGFLEDVATLRARGLAQGGSLHNAVVVAEEKVLNEGGLRFADEFVRHKALDALGDLYLAGAPLLARYAAERAGHALNHKLLCALFAESANWRVQTGPKRIAPAADSRRLVPARATIRARGRV
jgi:UDP-3-O-[3-hydroxymyristoyl] N-acetylglucosamine deacetylase